VSSRLVLATQNLGGITGWGARRIVCSLILVLLLAAPAAGGIYDRQQSLQDRIAEAQSKLADARAREQALAAEIASVSQRIRSLESEVGDVSSRLAALEEDLALHQRKLDKLTELYELQSDRLGFLREQYELSVERLSARLVAIYEGGEPTTMDVLLEAQSLSDILEQLDYVSSVAAQDRGIVKHVEGARDHMRELRARTGKTKARVAAVTRVVRIRTEQHRAIRTQLISQQQGLSAARGQKRGALADAREDAKEHAAHAAALQAQSAALASQIRSSQATVTYSGSTSDSTPSASGLIWPVGGSIVSAFGWRWGRMHEGIDIGAGYGAPIVASASGVVIYAGWMGGYGNLIIIDHGGGLATAYAHQSSFAVGGGAVAQGQTIGYVGCTGHCYGPHLHFEVRVNGSAVDPLGYL
jgi:murein DD-endopeptidase MepM/ murein hydrolase activator NlpD